MAEERRPFDKPIAELREAFVHARFAQEDVFGLPGIEAWLAKQRKAERPAELAWRRLIDAEHVRRPFHIRELPDLAVPQELPRGFSIRQMADVGDPLVAMLCESVDRKRVDVLPANERLTLFLLKGEDGAPAHAFTLTPQYNLKRRPGDPLAYTLFVPSDKDLLQVVLSRGWSVGPKKIATAARRLLCDGLEACIREKRGKAEADFDTAVAVSADGTKIVHADWVVVMGDHEYGDRTFHRDLRFPASAFQKRKILRTRPPRDEFDRHDEPYTLQMEPDPWDNAEWSLKRPRHTVQWLFKSARAGDYLPPDGLGLTYARATGEARCRTPSAQRLLVCTDGRVLFVHRDQCPSPLPDGGVEVTV